jgi:hypothetical protein
MHFSIGQRSCLVHLTAGSGVVHRKPDLPDEAISDRNPGQQSHYKDQDRCGLSPRSAFENPGHRLSRVGLCRSRGQLNLAGISTASDACPLPHISGHTLIQLSIGPRCPISEFNLIRICSWASLELPPDPIPSRLRAAIPASIRIGSRISMSRGNIFANRH